MSTHKLKVGIVGCGYIAKKHLRYVTKYVTNEKIALCDSDALRLDDFSKKVNIENKFNDLCEMLQKFRPDIVHILTPPTTHKDIAIKCLESGCHVLIEKPMCISTEEADSLIKIANEKKRLICVDHTRSFDPQLVKAKGILDSGKIGEIVNISVGYSYDFLERVSTDAALRWQKKLPGGIFFDIIPHCLYLLDDFLPALNIEKSVCRKNRDNVITDVWCIFSSSFGTASLHMSLNIFPLKNYVVFECTKGTLQVDFRNFLIILRRQYGLPNAVERIIGNLSVGIQYLNGTIRSLLNFVRGKLDPYAGLDSIIQQFYSAIVNNGRSPVPAEKAKSLLALTEKIFTNKIEEDPEEKRTQKKEPSEADILVTGSTGFIGRKLVNRLLERGYKIRILTHQNLSDEKLNSLFCRKVEIVHGDIYNYRDVDEACRGVNTVYHLAAAMKGDWNYYLDTTITGTKNVLESAIKRGVKHLVYTSTLNVYDAKRYTKNSSINENFPYEDTPEKRGPYSHSKLRAEKIVIKYLDQTDMSISILRPGLVYGPGGKTFPQDAGYRVGKKLIVVLGNGRRKLPLVYVDNLVDALLLAGELKEKAKGIFNVVDKDYPTQREFIKTYKKLSGERFFIIYIPMNVALFGFWVIEHLLSVFFNKSFSFRYKLKCVNKGPIYSTERIESALGWKQKVIFKDGLEFMLRQNNKMNNG